MMEFSQQHNVITINNEEFPLDLFLMVEPNYQVVDYRYYSPEQSHTIIEKGNQRGGELNWTDGNRYLKRATDLKYLKSQLNLDEQERQTEVQRAKFDNLSYGEKRKKEYPELEELIVTMWEHLVESNSTKLKDLEAKRQKIKKKFPKDT